MNYNYDVEIKYNIVEQELTQNVHLGEKEYSIEDVKNICDELYKIDILKLFKLKQYDYQSIKNSIFNLWIQFNNNIDLIEIINLIKIKIFMNTQINNEYAFIHLFNYDLLPYSHLFLSNLINKYNVIEVKNRLIEKINLL
jgi:hypothetical protein